MFLQSCSYVFDSWLRFQCVNNTIMNNNTVSEQTVGAVLALRDVTVAVRLVSTLCLLPSADLEQTSECSRLGRTYFAVLRRHNFGMHLHLII